MWASSRVSVFVTAAWLRAVRAQACKACLAKVTMLGASGSSGINHGDVAGGPSGTIAPHPPHRVKACGLRSLVCAAPNNRSLELAQHQTMCWLGSQGQDSNTKSWASHSCGRCRVLPAQKSTLLTTLACCSSSHVVDRPHSRGHLELD